MGKECNGRKQEGFRALGIVGNEPEILEKMNVPVGRVMEDNTGKMYVTEGKFSYFLSAKLKGSNLVELNQIPGISCSIGEIFPGILISI